MASQSCPDCGKNQRSEPDWLVCESYDQLPLEFFVLIQVPIPFMSSYKIFKLPFPTSHLYASIQRNIGQSAQ